MCLLNNFNVLLPVRWSVCCQLALTALLVLGQSPRVAAELMHPSTKDGYLAICSTTMLTGQLVAGQPWANSDNVGAWCLQHPRAFVVICQVALGFALPLAVVASIESMLMQMRHQDAAAFVPPMLVDMDE